MSKLRSLLTLLVVVLITGFGTWYIMSPAPAPTENSTVIPNAKPGTSNGQALPQITLNDLAGRNIQVSEKDKIIVVNFWATWCPPCKAEMPDLNLFAAKHQNDVDFYAINIQEPSSKVSDFITQHNYTRMQVLLDKDGAVAKQFHVSAIPTTIVADKKGVIRYRKSGSMTLAELENVIKGL